MGGRDGKGASPDWPVIFDLIASEYGYSWRRFVGLTYKQLDAFLEAIAARSHNNMATQAAMRGIKVEPYKKVEPVSEKALEGARANAYKILEQKRAAKNGKR